MKWVAGLVVCLSILYGWRLGIRGGGLDFIVQPFSGFLPALLALLWYE
jgi:hypothetical protein